MKLLITIFTSLLINIAFAKVEFNNEWVKCLKDTDCFMARNPCFFPIALNKKFKKEISIWSAQQLICDAYSGPSIEDYEAFCKNTCQNRLKNKKKK